MEKIAKNIVNVISKFDIDQVNLMEVCGTHTTSIARSGIRRMMPEHINLLSGPGCPVCVTSQGTIDYIIALAQKENVIITTFGDMVRVPGSKKTLGAFSPKVVYSALDAIHIALDNPQKEVVFIGVGFETTSPTIAATILAADKQKVNNFFVLPAFKLIPPALDFIARSPRINVQGFILPGHVSTIIGSQPYKFLAEKYHIAGCITGFEPFDILQGILNLVKQIAEKEARIDIEYRKVVKPDGNKKAQEILSQVFEVCDADWRGIGRIKKSGLTFKSKYKKYDATKRFNIRISKTTEPKGCICGNILLGLNTPVDCKLFAKKCTPLTPIGPCMVSSEGACAAYYKYGEVRRTKRVYKGRKKTQQK
jgi:hydrogenase expression/formation protein HypD